MTTPTGISATPTRIFQPLELNLEIETALTLEKFKEQQLIDTGFQLVRSVNETTAIYKKRK